MELLGSEKNWPVTAQGSSIGYCVSYVFLRLVAMGIHNIDYNEDDNAS